jgi:hypothetical protein
MTSLRKYRHPTRITISERVLPDRLRHRS